MQGRSIVFKGGGSKKNREGGNVQTFIYQGKKKVPNLV